MEKCISETIAEALEADLACGRWKSGERLPSVDELRERFGAGTRWGLTPLYFGAVNSFFMTKNFCADNSGSAIITNGLVTAVDEKYSPSGARKTLNTAVQENDWEPWVLGRIGEGNAAFVAPELACFMTKLANPGLKVIIR